MCISPLNFYCFLIRRPISQLSDPIDIAPLVLYRILFSGLVVFGGLWSLAKKDLVLRFTEPQLYFSYWGESCIASVEAIWIYAAYSLWLLGGIGMLLGWIYRLSAFCFLLGFSYLHILDATNYINHYYLISILGLFLLFLPAHRSFSLDLKLGRVTKLVTIPKWQLAVFKFQLLIVYTCAGIAKFHPDWFFDAMPMKIWLLQHQDFPILANLFRQDWVHRMFSWGGLIFDFSIGFILWLGYFRVFFYLLLVLFHVLTGWLFDIGLFPPLMIISALLFFPSQFHRRILHFLTRFNKREEKYSISSLKRSRWVELAFILFFIIQLFLPFRHHFLYTGNILWTEEGYRWSWRVMLVEKTGFCTFYVEDKDSEQVWQVDNRSFLTAFQEKRMSVRPDFIRQFAHHLATVYQKKEKLNRLPKVRVDAYVSLNGRASQRLVDSNVDLAQQMSSIWKADWILDLNPD